MSLKKENKKISADQGRSRNEIADLRMQLNYLIEVNDIPRTDAEDCEEIILKLGEALAIDISREEIKACHRISRREDAAIICEFKSRKKRDEFMFKKYKLKNIKLTGSDLEFTDSERLKIFINEFLTRFTKRHIQGRQRAKENTGMVRSMDKEWTNLCM